MGLGEGEGAILVDDLELLFEEFMVRSASSATVLTGSRRRL